MAKSWVNPLGRALTGMSSSRYKVEIERWWDDGGALAETQVAVGTKAGDGGQGMGVGDGGLGEESWPSWEGGRREGSEGTETQRGVMGGSAPAPQSLPRTALWLSSGSPQYSHFALGNTSAAMAPLRSPSPGVKATSSSVTRGGSAVGRKRRDVAGRVAPPPQGPAPSALCTGPCAIPAPPLSAKGRGVVHLVHRPSLGLPLRGSAPDRTNIRLRL